MPESLSMRQARTCDGGREPALAFSLVARHLTRKLFDGLGDALGVELGDNGNTYGHWYILRTAHWCSDQVAIHFIHHALT